MGESQRLLDKTSSQKDDMNEEAYENGTPTSQEDADARAEQVLSDAPQAPQSAKSAESESQEEKPARPAGAVPPPPTAISADAIPPSEVGDDEPLITPGMNWFVLRVASNKERSVRETLLRKIKIEGYEYLVNRILVPTEKVKTIKAGKQRIQQKMLYPGYVFVEMKLEEDGRIPQDVFFLFKETTGVGDFIGTAGRPSPMSIPEIEKMMAASKPADESPSLEMEFQKGDHIKIKEGPFENMQGSVDELLPEQGKVRVIVTIFGRATPIELEYWLIEKADEE